MTITVGGNTVGWDARNISARALSIPDNWTPYTGAGGTPFMQITDEPEVVVNSIGFDQRGYKYNWDDNLNRSDAAHCLDIRPPAGGGGLCKVAINSTHTNLGVVNIEAPVGQPGFGQIVIRATCSDAAPEVRVRGNHGYNGGVQIIADTTDYDGRGSRGTQNVKQVAVTGSPSNENDWPRNVAIKSIIRGGTSGVFLQCCPSISWDVTAFDYGHWLDASKVLQPFLNESTASGNLPAVYRNVNGGQCVKVDNGNNSVWNNWQAANEIRHTGRVNTWNTSPWANNDQDSSFMRTLRALVLEDIGTQFVNVIGNADGMPAQVDSDFELNRDGSTNHTVSNVRFNKRRHIRDAGLTLYSDCVFVDRTTNLFGININAAGSTVRRCQFGQNRDVQDTGTLGWVDDENTFGANIPDDIRIPSDVPPLPVTT